MPTDGSGIDTQAGCDLVECFAARVTLGCGCDHLIGPLAAARHATPPEIVHHGGAVDLESCGEFLHGRTGGEGIDEFVDLFGRQGLTATCGALWFLDRLGTRARCELLEDSVVGKQSRQGYQNGNGYCSQHLIHSM